jgi:hypothetical protein
MANNKIYIKRTSTTGNKPTTAQIANGELAVNMTDGIMYSTNGSVVFEVGANVTALMVGNTTANITGNSTMLRIANSTTSANLTPLTLTIGTSVVNTTVVATGANVFMNTTAVDVGNTVVTSTLLTLGGQVNANGSVGSAGQVLTSGATNNVYWTTPATGTVTSVGSANGIAGGPITSTGTLYAVAGNSTVFVNATGIHVNTTALPFGTGTVTSVASGNGITGGTITSTGTLVAVGGVGTVVNTGGINVLVGNNQLIANATGVWLDQTKVDHNLLSNYVADQHVAHSTVSITAGLGLTGGGTIAASRTLDVGAGNGIAVDADSVRVLAGTDGGLISNSTGVFVTAGQGLLTNSTGLHVGVANGITGAADSIAVTEGVGLAVNTTGVHVKANNGITANSTGTFVNAQTPLVANSTGLHIQGSTGNGTFSSGISAITVDSVGRVTSVTGSAGYVTSSGVTSVASGNGITGGTITSTGTLVAVGGVGTVVNTGGINVLANNGIVANSTGTFVNAQTPLVANATGLHIQGSAGNGTFSSGISAITVDSVGRVTSVTGSAGYVTSSGVTSVATGNGITGGTITSTGTLVAVGGVGTVVNTGGLNVLVGNNQLIANSTGVWVDQTKIDHNLLSNYVADQHVAHSTVTLTAGSGLTGGGTIAASRTFDVGAGNGISVAADAVYVNGGSTLTVNTTGAHVNSTLSLTTLTTTGNVTIGGNLTINGNVTTIGANNLSIVDNFLYLNSNNTTLNIDLGFAGNYNDGTYKHAGFFRDATDGFWKVFDGYTPEPDAAVDINTSNNTFNIAGMWIGNTRIGNTTVYATINSTTYSGAANNSTYLGGYTFAAPPVIGSGTANGISLTYANVSGQVNTATLYAATSANIASIVQANSLGVHVGANVVANTTALRVGNTTLTTTNAVFGGTIAANGGIGSAGQALISGGAANAYWVTIGNGTVTSVATGNGITGGTITTTGTLVAVAGVGTVVNTGGINVLVGNNQLIANSTGVWANQANFNHNLLLNYVADQHVAHSTVSITAGNGLTGGGTIDASRTLDVGAANGITVAADSVAVTEGVGLAVNTTGVHVKANTGIVANSTGTFVNATYIATIASNTSLYSNGSFTNAFTVGTASYFVTNGNFGIANSVPTDKLSVNGTTYFGGVTKFVTGAWHLSTDGKNRFYYGPNARTYFGSGDGIYEFRNSTDTGTVVIDNSGNTGISNTSPTHKLSVNGTTYISGNVGIGTTTVSAYALTVNGSFAATTKSFVIDHPTKPDMKLRYGSLEGPENGVYVRGRSNTSTIELPDYWIGLVDENSITVNLTPIGKKQELYVKAISNNIVTVGGARTVDFFYTIFAERKDVEKLVVEF